MEQAGLDFRATKDLDIVISVEALDVDFVMAFWDFIREGNYRQHQKSTGKKLFYRFQEPENEAYPVMLELFARVPDLLNVGEGSHLTPIPVDECVSSLSAILLNDDYYHFIHAGRLEMEGLPVVRPEHLIPLKARAWLDLTKRREAGESIDNKDIRKHRNDVIRLYQIMPNLPLALPEPMVDDMRLFLDELQMDTSLNLKDLGIKNAGVEQVATDLRRIYGLERQPV
jgi:hypothetical protein